MPHTVERQRPVFLDGPLQLYIGGKRVTTGDRLATIDPATGETLAEVPVATTTEVDLAVQAATEAFRSWRGTPATERARMLWTLADLIESHSEELAAIEVLDNGKPIGEARAVDIALTIEIFRYYAGWTTKIAGSVPPNSIRGMLTMIRREPVGVVAAITPWNFPLLEVAYKLGPALAAGCTVVVKPSELAPLTTLRLMDLVEEAGLPAGVVNAIVGGPEIGAALVRHPGVQKVAFTGQTATGIEIARQAAGDLKRVTLELGGKSPNIIFADADLDAAVGGAFGGIFFNQGEACVAGSRLFVEASVEREVTERLVAKAAEVRLGHGLDPATDMGPLISANHRRRVLGHVDAARDDGAQIAVGGAEARPEGLEQGFFIEPTVVREVSNGMRVAQEEIFGPVLSVISWRTDDDLAALANAVPYGLAAGIWTSDTSRALRLAEELDAGTVWINTYGMFDVAVPFGGRKHSGFGRELGEEALEPYLTSKSVWVDLQSAAAQSGQAISR
jgi:acyl-CoA reductase-like NAD-dependent aldehyde dehydrogenase